MIEINSGLISNIGIILDIIGAFFLAESFLLKKTNQIVKESSSFWNGNPFLLPSYITQRLEAKTGFVYLLFGFLLQYFANSTLIQQGPDRYVKELLLIGFVLWLMSYLLLKVINRLLARKALIKEDGGNFLRGLKDAKEQGDKRFIELAKFYGEALDISRNRKEAELPFAKRVYNYIENGVRKYSTDKKK